MKLLALLGASAAAILSVPAGAAITTNYALTFTNGTAFVTPTPKTEAGEYTDIFTFTLDQAATFSGSLSTQRLRDENGNIVSDLNFGNSIDGVALDNLTPFTKPLPGDALEVVNIASTLLAAGTHTLTVNYTVDTASLANGATYAGPVFAAEIAAVPEPASWAMFVAAFGFVGAGLRQQRRARVTFAA